MTATLARSATPTVPPLTRRGGRPRETVLFLLALALIALHVLDDNYIQPQLGTSPGDHVVSGLVPLAMLGLAAWAYPRLRSGWRAALALALGVLGIAAGIEGYYYTREVGPSGDDFTGLRGAELAGGAQLAGDDRAVDVLQHHVGGGHLRSDVRVGPIAAGRSFSGAHSRASPSPTRSA